jgi:uncharacterized membrane protein
MKSPAKACLDNSRNTEVGEVAAISRGAIWAGEPYNTDVCETRRNDRTLGWPTIS